MQPQLGAPGALAAGWGSLTSLASGLTLSWDSHSALCVTPSRDRGTLLCVPLVQGRHLGQVVPCKTCLCRCKLRAVCIPLRGRVLAGGC